MRVAHIVCNFERGGVASLVVVLAQQLVALGKEVDVIQVDRPTGSPLERRAIDKLVRSGVSVYSLNRNLHHPGLRARLNLWRLIHSRRYQVVHSHLNLPDTIVGSVRIVSPVRFAHVTTIHSSRESERGFFGRWCARKATAVYCSESARKVNPVGLSKSFSISNGVDLAEYRDWPSARAATRSSLELDETTVAIVSVAELREDKNYGCALEAIALLVRKAAGEKIRYLVCGGGPGRWNLDKKVADLGLASHVTLLGRRTDIPALLAASDVFLSVSRHEGMPLSVIEALAAGLPCVLSPIEAHREVTLGMLGCYFPLENCAEAVAATVEGVIAQPELRDVLQASRDAPLHRLSITESARKYCDLYRRLAGSQAAQEAPSLLVDVRDEGRG